MGEQHALVGHSDDIVVKRAGRDRLGRLFDEQRARRVEAMQACHCAAGLFVLACGERATGTAIDKQFDPAGAMAGRHAHMVCGALIAKAGRHSIMHGKVRRVGKRQPQLAHGVRPFL